MEVFGEAALITAAQGGSTAAFSRLVALHQQALRRFLRRLCGDVSEADDLAQECFVAAWSRIGRYDGRSAFRVWVFAIAWNKANSHFRARIRRLRRDLHWMEAQQAQAGDPDLRLDVAAAIAALPPEQRAAIALCLSAEFSHAEAAAVLQIPVGTVKSHVARGRVKLLKALGAPDVDDR